LPALNELKQKQVFSDPKNGWNGFPLCPDIFESMVLDMQITSKKLRSIVKELEKAVLEHHRWLHGWHRSLIFDLPLDEICFSRHSYRQCHFGQWYCNLPSHLLRNHSGFMAIDQHHRRLHDSAYALAIKLKYGKKISINDYENLIEKEWNFSKTVLDFKEELLKTLFEFDPLTDILNRQAFIRILHGEYARLSRTAESCCICMVDLDYFKAINDTYGHLAGDRVLRIAAQYLNHKLRPYDSICRYGGEEFLICLPNTNLDAAKDIMNRLRIGLKLLRIDLDEGKEVKITASFGITKMTADTQIEGGIAQADEAMYAAKQGGRDRVVVYEEMTVTAMPLITAPPMQPVR
jgi:diguanylate cyclase